MANYRVADPSYGGPGAPPIEALVGGELAKKDRVMATNANVHALPDILQRQIGRVGVNGCSRFQILSSDPNTLVFQNYPLIDAERECFHRKWTLAPGTLVRVSAIAVPTGMTSKYVFSAGGWVADVPFGEIKIEYTFTLPGGPYTGSKTLQPVISAEQYAGEAQGDAAQWSRLGFYSTVISPNDNKDIEDAYNASEGVTCELTVKFIGGIRNVDLLVSEVPYLYVRDIGTDTNDEYFRPMVDPGGSYPRDYPVSELSPTDPTYGTELLQDVSDRQHTELGPILAGFSSWVEDTQPVDVLTVNPVTLTSTTFKDMLHQTLTTWSATYPGWSVSAGGQAQQFKSSSSTRIMRDKNACVPVRIWVRAWRTGTLAATLRFQTESYSVAELSITSGTAAWRSCTGHLRCGLGPNDTSVLMMFGKTGNGTDVLRVTDFVVEYLDL